MQLIWQGERRPRLRAAYGFPAREKARHLEQWLKKRRRFSSKGQSENTPLEHPDNEIFSFVE
jgi:hypothetical protein